MEPNNNKFVTWLFVKWAALIKFLQKKIIGLEKKGYIIPANTKDGVLYTQNKLINSFVFIADLICIIIILLGMSQQIITFVGIITYAIYTLTEQIKVIDSQYSKSKNKTGSFERKSLINWHHVPPNILNVIIISIIFVILVVLAFIRITGGAIGDNMYIICIIASISILSYLKVKYLIFDTFGIINWKFIEV